MEKESLMKKVESEEDDDPRPEGPRLCSHPREGVVTGKNSV